MAGGCYLYRFLPVVGGEGEGTSKDTTGSTTFGRNETYVFMDPGLQQADMAEMWRRYGEDEAEI